MQVWSKNDTFDYGALVYGTNVIGYLGARPRLSNYQYGQMHNGYGAGTCGCRAQSTVQISGNPAGWQRRQYFPAPVRVRLVSRKHAALGTAVTSQLIAHGVLARITAGTLAQNGTSGVSYDSLTCYACRVGWDAGAGKLRLSILRYNGGAEVTLFTTTNLPGSSGDFLSDVEIRLDLTNDGSGNVTLTAYLTNVVVESSIASVYYAAGGSGQNVLVSPGSLGVGTPISGSTAQQHTFGKGDTFLIGTVTDISGSKITAAGRCGFFMDCEKAYNASADRIVSLATVFEVSDLTDPLAPVVLWRDEFQRAAPQLCGSMTDLFTTPGNNLQSDFGADQASSEGTNLLRRDTGSEAVLTPITVAGGKAITLDGAADYLELQNADKTYPAPALPVATEVTVAVWAKLTSSTTVARPLYEGVRDTPASSGAGFRFGLTVTPGSILSLSLTMFFPSSNISASAALALAAYLNQTWCYVFTFKANANPITGEGRVRFYVGRVGVATMVGETVLPANVRPQWLSEGTHTLGTLASHANIFAGTLDELHVFFKELTPFQVSQVCNTTIDPASFLPMNLVAGWHFDTFTDIGGTDGKRWAPWYAGAAGGISANNADWFREKNTITVADPGLVPIFPSSQFLAFAQRPVDDLVNQDRSIDFKPASDTSVAGIIVRAAPSGPPGIYSGYRLDVAAGTPARVALYRVLAGQATKMAEQSPSTGTVNLSSGSYSMVTLHVAQQEGSGPLGGVVLTVKIGGVIVPMVSVEPGKSLVDIAGNVIDVSNQRILSGAVEGFHGFIDGLGNLFDNWSQGTLGGATPTGAAPNYPIPHEYDGATGDLAAVLAPEWSIEQTNPAPRTQTPYESGHVQTLALDSYERRGFALHHRALESAALAVAIAALRAFWDDHNGGEIPFAWDPGAAIDGEQAGLFRFKADSWSDEVHGYNRSTSFEVEEVLAAPTS